MRPFGVFLRSNRSRGGARWAVSTRYFSRVKTVTCLVCWATLAMGQDRNGQTQDLNRQFQTAVAEYDAGKLPEAAAHLEALLPYADRAFEVHELLGLVYAGELQDAKAVKQLDIAVRLKPDSAAARTNLAASLVHAGKSELAEEQFRKAARPRAHQLRRQPQSGRTLHPVEKDGGSESLSSESAGDPSLLYDNGYDLALAYFLAGNLSQASNWCRISAADQNTGGIA